MVLTALFTENSVDAIPPPCSPTNCPIPLIFFLKRSWVNSSLAWKTDSWVPETLETVFRSVLFQKCPGGHAPRQLVPLVLARCRAASKKVCLQYFQKYVCYFVCQRGYFLEKTNSRDVLQHSTWLTSLLKRTFWHRYKKRTKAKAINNLPN